MATFRELIDFWLKLKTKEVIIWRQWAVLPIPSDAIERLCNMMNDKDDSNSQAPESGHVSNHKYSLWCFTNHKYGLCVHHKAACVVFFCEGMVSSRVLSNNLHKLQNHMSQKITCKFQGKWNNPFVPFFFFFLYQLSWKGISKRLKTRWSRRWKQRSCFHGGRCY